MHAVVSICCHSSFELVLGILQGSQFNQLSIYFEAWTNNVVVLVKERSDVSLRLDLLLSNNQFHSHERNILFVSSPLNFDFEDTDEVVNLHVNVEQLIMLGGHYAVKHLTTRTNVSTCKSFTIFNTEARTDWIKWVPGQFSIPKRRVIVKDKVVEPKLCFLCFTFAQLLEGLFLCILELSYRRLYYLELVTSNDNIDGANLCLDYKHIFESLVQLHKGARFCSYTVGQIVHELGLVFFFSILNSVIKRWILRME